MKLSIIVNYICDPNQETPTPSVKNKGLAATSLYLYTTANAIKVTFTHIFCTNKSSSKAFFSSDLKRFVISKLTRNVNREKVPMPKVHIQEMSQQL